MFGQYGALTVPWISGRAMRMFGQYGALPVRWISDRAGLAAGLDKRKGWISGRAGLAAGQCVTNVSLSKNT